MTMPQTSASMPTPGPRGHVRVDLLVLVGVLSFGVAFIGLATYLGQESRTAYRIDPIDALPHHLQAFVDALGTYEPILPRLAEVPEVSDGGGPYSSAVQEARALLLSSDRDPTPAVALLASAPDVWRAPVPHDLIVARARALVPASELVPLMSALASEGSAGATAKFNLGLLHLLAGEPRRAVEPLAAAIALAPDDGELRLLCAIALERAGNLAAARMQLDAAERRMPEKPDPPYRAARLALEAGELTVARELAGRAVHRGRTWAAAHLLLGTICVETKEFGQAKREFRDVLQLDPTNALARSKVQWLDGVPE